MVVDMELRFLRRERGRTVIRGRIGAAIQPRNSDASRRTRGVLRRYVYKPVPTIHALRPLSEKVFRTLEIPNA